MEILVTCKQLGSHATSEPFEFSADSFVNNTEHIKQNFDTRHFVIEAVIMFVLLC